MTQTAMAFSGEAKTWLDHWPDGLIALSESGHVLAMSPKAIELLGFSNSQANGKHAHELLCSHSRGVAHVLDECPLCAKHINNEHQSTVWHTASGDNISVDYRVMVMPEGGSTLKVISFQNNTERLHNQAEMEKFAQYVDCSPSPIGEFDDEGQLLFGNPALQELMLEHGFDDDGNAKIYPSNIADLCFTCWQEKKVMHNVEVEVEGAWLGWHFHPIEDAADSSITVMAYGFDITEQKLALAEIAKQKAEARRDFFAKMVHELRTPLNAIVGFSQVLLRRTEKVLPERDLASLKAIRAAGLQLNEMVSDTLDISKIEAGMMEVEREAFQLNRLLDAMSEQMTTLAEAKKLEYKVECEPDLQLVSDPKKVRQIIVNLISNAIKYTPKGNVWVVASAQSHERLGRVIAIVVSDSGMGIPKDQIGKLFLAYQQVSEEKNKGIQGTGLGLALVAELVRMLEGEISVESELDKGSSFTVVLPVE